MQQTRVWLAENPWAWQLGLAVVAGLLVARIVFRIFFDDRADLLEALRYYIQPDWLSFLRGEWGADWWQSFKLGIYLALSGRAGVYVFVWLQKSPTAH